MQGRERDRFALFALIPKGKLKPIWVDLHLLLWKNFIGALVGIELEGERFLEAKIWGGAWKRLESKIAARTERVNMIRRRAVSRGEEIPDLSKSTRLVEPIAAFDKEGILTWNAELVEKIKGFAKNGELQAQSGPSGGA